MINLRADNRALISNAKYAYIISNLSSASGSIFVTNQEPFTTGGPILIGELGHTDAEIFKANQLTLLTGEMTFTDSSNVAAATQYAHAESTRITAIPFDMVRFYWTAAVGSIADETPVYNTNTPLTGWLALDPSSFYSTFGDANHSSGFGWFVYKNSTTNEISQVSNPIPYAGFALNTVLTIFNDFESLLNTNELKLVTMQDKYSWLNEGLSLIKNRLNLSSVEYSVSTPQTVTTVSGTAEYILPDDFSDVVEIVFGSPTVSPPPTSYFGRRQVEFIPVSQVLSYNLDLGHTYPYSTRYYLRGRYLGFAPTPTESGNLFTYTYRTKATRAVTLSTYIELPDNAWYALKDWMMHRALLKFGNPNASAFLVSYNNAMDLSVQASIKRSANLDSWDILPSSNS